jgi:formyl-CoA transferase
MAKALEGVKVLDFTHVQSGPTCTQLLAWFGADVIKVEKSGEGDATRGQLRDIPDADSLYFTMLNHNKRSITVNTKTPKGKEILERLIKECDVLVENFAPGAKFSTSTSHSLIKRSKISLPLWVLVFTVIERLLWFNIV